MHKGKLIIFSGPSGSGKTTIVQNLLKKYPSMGFSVSATTRLIRPNEKDGADYYFLSKEIFLDRVEKGEFVEWEEVYKGVYYGTLRDEVERIRTTGHHVLFDIDVEGGLSIKKIYGKNALAVFVKPPTVEKLRERLKQRATETEESLHKRMEKMEHELTYSGKFDKVLINDMLHDATAEAESLVNEFLANQ